MSLSKSLRSRKSVDCKKLNDGEDLPRILLGKHAVKAPAPVLPDIYSVERIIDRKETSEVIITIFIVLMHSIKFIIYLFIYLFIYSHRSQIY